MRLSKVIFLLSIIDLFLAVISIFSRHSPLNYIAFAGSLFCFSASMCMIFIDINKIRKLQIKKELLDEIRDELNEIDKDK